MSKLADFYWKPGSQGDAAGKPSLFDAMRGAGPKDEDRIAAYLASGDEFFSAMGAERDAVTDDMWIPGASGSLMTDGVWAWPDSLAHYVRRHHVALPPDFLAHIRANDYTVPAVPRERHGEVFAEFFPNAAAHQPAAPSAPTGFLTWYVPNLTVARAHRLISELAEAGLPTLDGFMDELFGFRETADGTREPLPLKGGNDSLAADLADEHYAQVEFTCWHGRSQPHTGTARRTDESTQRVTLPLTGITGRHPEDVAEALNRIRAQDPAGCLGFVLDLTGATADEDWDRVLLGAGGHITAWPDAIGVLRAHVPALPELAGLASTPEGPLDVFHRPRSTT